MVPRYAERLASLGIMGDQLRAAIKTFVLSQRYRIKGFQEALNWDSFMPRDASLSNSYTHDWCCFPSSGPDLILLSGLETHFIFFPRIGAVALCYMWRWRCLEKNSVSKKRDVDDFLMVKKINNIKNNSVSKKHNIDQILMLKKNIIKKIQCRRRIVLMRFLC